MGSLLITDKRAKALIFVVCIAGLSVLLGLYLILVHDTNTKAHWSANVGSLYFMQSNKQGFSGKNANHFLDKAYDEHIHAVQLAPYDAALWIKLSYVLAVKHDDKTQALRALDIAEALAPQSAVEIARYRAKITRKHMEQAR